MTPTMPSRGGLLARLAIAAIVGAFIVVCVVMPAEYRKDPTGFGRLTGLLDLTTPIAASKAGDAAVNSAPVSREPDPLIVSKVTDPSLADRYDTALVEQNHQAAIAEYYKQPFKTETVQIPLGPDGEVEYKLRMKAGQSVVYSWKPDSGTVYYDFHGHPPDKPNEAQGYIKVQEADHGDGVFIAPVDGIHGWFWLNLTPKKMVITLKISGFYDSHDYVK